MLDVGGGIAGIAGVRGKFGALSTGDLKGSAHFWSWVIFLGCIGWLTALYFSFGGLTGDVAS